MTVFESLPLVDGVVVANASGSIVFWSRAAEALFGYASEEASSLDVARLFDAWPAAPATLIARRKDGSTFLAEVTIDSIDDATSVITIRDRWGDEALESIEELDDIGVFDRDLVGDDLRWSEQLFHIHGLPPAPHPPALEELRARVVEEDRARVLATLDDAIRMQAALRVDYRFRRGEGDLRKLRVIGRVVADETGRALRIYGSVRDITEGERRR